MLSHDTDKEIAGFAMADPYCSRAIIDGTAQKVCTSDDLWKTHPCCTFIVNSSILEQHTETVKEIIDLFVSTAQKLENLDLDNLDLKNRDLENINNDNTLSKAGTFLGLDKNILTNILSNTAIRFDPNLLKPDIEGLNAIALYMKDSMGVLKSEINMEQLVDDSFILNSIAENDL
jgi:NitT/TauT family transport system substrate-binding protein